MKQEKLKSAELERFDALATQINEYAHEVKYGMGGFETPYVIIDDEAVAFGLYKPKENDLRYSPSVYELENALQNYVRRNDLADGAYKVRAEKARRALPILEQMVAKYVEVVNSQDEV